MSANDRADAPEGRPAGQGAGSAAAASETMAWTEAWASLRRQQDPEAFDSDEANEWRAWIGGKAGRREIFRQAHELWSAMAYVPSVYDVPIPGADDDTGADGGPADDMPADQDRTGGEVPLAHGATEAQDRRGFLERCERRRQAQQTFRAVLDGVGVRRRPAIGQLVLCIDRALDRLPARTRHVYELDRLSEMPPVAIAACLCCSDIDVRLMLAHAYEALRECYEGA